MLQKLLYVNVKTLYGFNENFRTFKHINGESHIVENIKITYIYKY